MMVMLKCLYLCRKTGKTWYLSYQLLNKSKKAKCQKFFKHERKFHTSFLTENKVVYFPVCTAQQDKISPEF